MYSVFAITSNKSQNLLRDSEFFSSKEKAFERLKEIADDRRYQLGVNIIRETESDFCYLFGWEESEVKFQILEIKVK